MPSLLKLTNNAVGRLASNRSTTDTSLILQAGEGVRFPSLAAGEFFRATLVRSSDGAIEIVNVTARATDTLTVTRAQEGTTALAFLAGDRVELRLTAGAFQYNADWLEAFAANANNLASGTVPAARLTGTYNISISGNAATATNATQLGGVAASGYARTDGAGASGTWNISISGNAATATSATSATNATNASNVPWTGVSGRPTAVSSFTNDSGYVNASGAAAQVNTTNVLNATAGASTGAVGTYAWCIDIAGSDCAPGATKAGSSLRYNFTASGSLTGTWRAMSGQVANNPGFFLRIS